MVHLLPVRATPSREEGLVAFTSGIDFQRTEFHGSYTYIRDPPTLAAPWSTPHRLLLKFRYLGEVPDNELVDHVLTATTPIDPFSYRDNRLNVVAEMVTDNVANMYLAITDRLYPDGSGRQ